MEQQDNPPTRTDYFCSFMSYIFMRQRTRTELEKRTPAPEGIGDLITQLAIERANLRKPVTMITQQPEW